MKNVKNKLLLLGLSVLLIFSSCEVGLGASVDTEAPNINITYPPESSVIKGTFVLAGTCTDDAEVGSVTVTLKNSDTNKVLGTFDATVNGETWSIELNKAGDYNGFEYPDGRYSVDVFATDTSERTSGVASSSFDIDNTAPVLILSKPLAVGSESPTIFGQSIKLAGDISEEHTTTSLVMHIQEWDSKKKAFVGGVKDISVSDFASMSSDSPLVVAKYSTIKQINNADEKSRESMKDLREKYLSIYGSVSENADGSFSSSGDKIFYASVQLTDNAKEYKNPGDAGVEGGNSSNLYYINSTDFYNNLASEGSYSLTATKLRKIINKTCTEYSAEQQKKISSLVSNYSITSESLSQNSSKLLVNPDNNPTFNVNEYEAGKVENIPVNKNLNSQEEKEYGYRTVSEGSSINLTLEAGKDGFSIDPSKLSIKVYKMLNSTDTDIDHKSGNSVWEIRSAGEWTGSASTNLGTAVEIKNTTIGGTPAPYTDSFFTGGDFYRLVVEGQDTEGGYLVPKTNSGYGFLISSNSNPPTINMVTPADGVISGNKIKEGYEVEFKVITEGLAANPEVTLVKTGNSLVNHISVLKQVNGETGVKIINTADSKEIKNINVPIVSIEQIGSMNQIDNKYEYSIKLKLGGSEACVPEANGKYKYSFVIKAVDSAAKFNNATFSFYVDNDGPVIKDIKISPVESDNKVNGTISIVPTITNDPASVEYEVYVDGIKEASGITDATHSNFGTLNDLKAEFNTANVEYEGKLLKVKVIAKDSVGNETTKEKNSFKINQESDRPQIHENNFKSILTNRSDVNNENGNVFDKNSKIIGSVSDIDGLSSVTYKINNEDGTSKVSSTSLTTTSGALFNIPVPTDCGLYEVILVANDSTYESGDSYSKQYRTITKTFWIAVDNEAPKLTLTNIDSSIENIFAEQYKNKNSIEYEGTVSDDWELDNIDVYVNNVILNDEHPTINGSTWTYELDFTGKAEGTYTVKFVAKDRAGKTKELSSTIIRDATPPSFVDKDFKPLVTETFEITTEPTNGWFKETSLDIKGYVKDITSNIKSVEYKVDDGAYTPLNITYASEENKKQVTFAGTVLNLKNDSVITVKVTDVAGNGNEKSLPAVKIDTISPSIDLTNYYSSALASGVSKPDATAYVSNSGTIYINGEYDLWLKGTVNDDVASGSPSGSSGVSAIYFDFINQATNSSSIKVSSEQAITEYEQKIPKGTIKNKFGTESSSANLYVLVVDKAGKEKSVPLVSIVYDVDYPKAQINKVKYKDTESSVTTANGIITFEGIAHDNQSVEKVQIEYSEDGTNWTLYGTAIDKDTKDENNIPVDLNNWSIDVDTTTLGKKTYYFRAVATDSLGNKGNTGKAGTQYEVETDDYKFTKLKVDQDSDRPVITFSNIEFDTNMSAEKTSWLKKTNDMYVSVTDDDGVSKIEYTTASGDSGWTEVSNGKINLQDGSYTIRFRVIDGAGTVFESNSDIKTPPKLKDSKNRSATTEDLKGVLYVKIDKSAPSLENRKYFIWNGSSYPDSGEENTTNIKFGGSHNKLKLTLDANDENGIKKVEVKLGKKTWTGSLKSENSYEVIIQNPVDLVEENDYTEDSYEFRIVVTDNADLTNEKTFNLKIDNAPAKLTVDSHGLNEQVSQNFVLKGIVDNADTKTKIKFYTDKNSTIPNNKDWTVSETNNVVEYTGIIASWRINVDGKTAAAADSETHIKSLKDLFVAAYSDSVKLNNEGKVEYKNSNDLFTTVSPLYFHFRVEDEVGNISTTSFPLMVDPQGDLPSVKMTYPVATEADGTVILSGAIKAQGEASTIVPENGDNPIMGIYMQIDPSYNGTFTTKWNKTASNNPATSLKSPSKNENLSNFYKDSLDNSLFENVFARYNLQASDAKKKTETATANNTYGIYVGNKNSWNITINRAGELNSGETDADGNVLQNTIAIKLIIVDSFGNLTETKPLVIKVDADAPIFGTKEFYVYQYAWVDSSNRTYYTNNGDPENAKHSTAKTLYADPGCKTDVGKTWDSTYTANFASEIYRDDMSLKDEWWLSGSVEDESDIYEIIDVKSDYKIVEKNNSDENGTYTQSESRSNVIRYESEAGNHGFIFNMRVGSNQDNEFGKLNYQIKATEYNVEENLRKSSVKIFSINYDNLPPAVDDENSLSGYFNMNKKVVNSYGFYTLGTAAYENGSNGNTQSGFARALFYFTKGTDVFDTYIKRNSTGNKVSNSAAGISKEDGVYWKQSKATTINADTVTINSTEINIHKGGLVKFGGAYYTVKAKTGSDITLDRNPSESLVNAPIYFAIGHVVDRNETSSGSTFEETNEEGYGYYNDILDNDDYMIETLNTGVTRTVWSGTVNSNNLPDGPAVLHYVVFDAAGNSTEKTLDVLVANNAPRLASVKVWCDYDGSGTERADGNETQYYYYAERLRTLTVNGEKVRKASDVTSRMVISGANDTAFMKVKDSVYFVPEIVGGNGDLYYSYNIATTQNGSGTESVLTKFGTGHDDGNIFEPKTGSYLLTDLDGDKYISGHSDDTERFEVPYANLGASGNKYFNFTIRDAGKSEDGTVINDLEKCLSATMQVKLEVLEDITAPKVNVHRFFYQNKDTNSLYKNSANNGHIELEADLTDAIKAATNGATALGDDPKVSGKITVRGTAYDDIRLKTLSVQFAGSNNKGHKNIKTKTLAATYTNGEWVYESEDSDDNMNNNGWTFTATDRYNDATGHFVDWECNIDTSFIEGIADIDRIFTVVAKDERGNGSGRESATTASGTDESKVNEYNRPTYQMDVVPYIRRVKTSLSSANASNPSVYDRSSSGHYPVYITYNTGATFVSGETIELVGFNFKEGNGNKSITLTASSTSGALPATDTTVNGINVLNNINNPDAKGYDLNENGTKKAVTLTTSNYSKYAYNRQANDTNNNLLTDDVYIDVWQVNNQAANPGNVYALDMHMGINPSTGLIGFAYLKGKEFAMANGANSYVNYDFTTENTDLIRCASFAYDKLGYSYGALLPANEGDNYQLLSSRWGTNKHRNIGNNRISLEVQDKDRYQSTSYATLVGADNKTTVYMAFFDNINGTIRLKSGTLSGTNVTGTDDFDADDGNSDNKSILIANSNGSNCLGTSGEYVSVGVTSDNRVVMVWYGGGNLMYAYSNSTGRPTSATTSTWTVKRLLNNGGKYCKIAVDSDNGIHIAAYDVLNADLKYYYLSSYSADPKEAVVDSYLTIGQNISLDVAKKTVNERNYQIPYIGYWGTYPKRPRYAFIKDPAQFFAASNAKLNGTENGKYTGIWECTLIPSASTVYIDENTPWRVNIGVWKSDVNAIGAGTLANSFAPDSKTFANSTATATTGACYGNGTNNAVLSYLRTNPNNAATNFVETVQLKGTIDYSK